MFRDDIHLILGTHNHKESLILESLIFLQENSCLISLSFLNLYLSKSACEKQIQATFFI